MKRKKLLLILAVVLVAALLLGTLFAGQIRKWYRNLDYYLGEPTQTEQRVMEYAKAHDLTFGDYPSSLIALLERNPETERFVLEYPLWEDAEYDLSEYENSPSVPLFMQWDQRWGYERYGSDVIGITGCGPTCLAMVGYYLTGDDWFTPANVAAFAWDSDYYASGYGSSWTLISEGGVKLGLDVTELPLSKERMMGSLAEGNPIICAMGPGAFTESGHYIVLTGVEDGKFRVNDPNSHANSERLWSYEEIEKQIRNIWEISADN